MRGFRLCIHVSRIHMHTHTHNNYPHTHTHVHIRTHTHIFTCTHPHIHKPYSHVYTYHIWEIFGRGRSRQIVSHSPKFSSPIFTGNVYGICTDCCLFANFFLANSFYHHGSPKFSPTKYFLCTVCMSIHTCTCPHTHTHTHAYTHTHTAHTLACPYTFTCPCTHIFLHTHIAT